MGELVGAFSTIPDIHGLDVPWFFLVASKDYDETQIQENHHVSLITAQTEFVMRRNFYISLSRNRAATL